MNELFAKTTFEEFYLHCFTSLLDEFERNKNNCVEHFKKHKIMVKRKNNIYKFKYGGDCKFDKPFMFAARGAIISDDFVIPSFNKFFNLDEWEKYVGMNKYQILQKLEAEGYSFLLTPKYDGSYIQVFADPAGELHVYTLGSLEENRMNNETNATFKQKTLELMFQYEIAHLRAHPYTSAVYELICKENKNVTIYNYERLIPLALIDSSYLPNWRGTSDIFYNFLQDQLMYPNWPTTIETLEWNIIEGELILKHLKDEFGQIPEGLVLYAVSKDRNAFPIFKIKMDEYNQHHKIIKTDARRNLLDLQLRELFGAVPAPNTELSNYLEEFRAGLKTLSVFFDIALQKLAQIDDMKEYSKIVENMDYPLKYFAHVFYSMRGKFDQIGDDKYEFIRRCLISGKTPLIFKIHKYKNVDWYKIKDKNV